MILTTQCQTAKPAAATQAADQPGKPAPATPIDTTKVELGGSTWNTDWDAIVEKAIPPEMVSRQVPRDVQRFCPRFYDMSETDKRAFWAYFFQALAGAEAGLNPTTGAHHTEPEVSVPDSVTGMSGRTEGLLQLTYADAERYGCDFDWQADHKRKPNDPARTILQPKNNLECGVQDPGEPDHRATQAATLLYLAGYWSTLQRAAKLSSVRQRDDEPSAGVRASDQVGRQPSIIDKDGLVARLRARTTHINPGFRQID